MKKNTKRLIALLVLLALLMGSFCSAELSLGEGESGFIPAASQSAEPVSTTGSSESPTLGTSPTAAAAKIATATPTGMEASPDLGTSLPITRALMSMLTSILPSASKASMR